MEDAPRYKLLDFISAGAATALLFSVAVAVGLDELKAPPLLVQRLQETISTSPAVAPAPAPAFQQAVVSNRVSVPPGLALPSVVAPIRTAAPVPALPPLRTIAPRVPRVPVPSEFLHEQMMSYAQLMKRWDPLIVKAAKRFNVPDKWIREVMRIESGGRTMMAENRRIVSSQGALGLMQIQRGTYAEMRAQYRLGPDPFNPHDNIFAGAAYLRWLRGKYGYPAMFEAYDDGPGHFEQRTTKGKLLPAETRNYVTVIRTALGDKPRPVLQTARAGTPKPATLPLPAAANVASGVAPAAAAAAAPGIVMAATNTAQNAGPSTTNGAAAPSAAYGTIGAFTRPDGGRMFVDCTLVTGVRAPLVNEYPSTVQSVITVGNQNQGVIETEEVARQVVRSHGGQV